MPSVKAPLTRLPPTSARPGLGSGLGGSSTRSSAPTTSASSSRVQPTTLPKFQSSKKTSAEATSIAAGQPQPPGPAPTTPDNNAVRALVFDSNGDGRQVPPSPDAPSSAVAAASTPAANAVADAAAGAPTSSATSFSGVQAALQCAAGGKPLQQQLEGVLSAAGLVTKSGNPVDVKVLAAELEAVFGQSQREAIANLQGRLRRWVLVGGVCLSLLAVVVLVLVYWVAWVVWLLVDRRLAGVPRISL